MAEPTEDEWEYLKGLPGIVRINLGYAAVTEQPDDPDQTMTLALTHRETAVLVFGAILVHAMFHELGGVVFRFLSKVEEVSEAQNFLAVPDEGEDEA